VTTQRRLPKFPKFNSNRASRHSFSHLIFTTTMANHTQSASGSSVRTCGILGATGTVGQQFVLLLQSHPYFKLTVLGASERSAGKTYSQAVKWKKDNPMPKTTGEMIVKECNPEHFEDCQVVFSGLDSDVAGPIG